MKSIVEKGWNHSQIPLKYGKDSKPIFMITDSCTTGISEVISQGDNWQTAKVMAFYLAKLNLAQQNYTVHKIEMLAGIETMLHYWDILQGVHFQWITDHKGLIHLLNQKNLSGWQACWIEKTSEFDFKVVYIPSSENILADALSQIYSNDTLGTVHSTSEYTVHNTSNIDFAAFNISILLLIGNEASASRQWKWETLPAETGCPEMSKEFAC